MVTKQIYLNVWNLNHTDIYVNKGEINSRNIEVYFDTGNSTFLNLSGKSVVFYALKPDGTTIYNTCTVDESNNKVSLSLTSQVLAISGVLNCEFHIFSGEELLLKVTGLKIIVSDTSDFSEAIESTSEFNSLISAIENANSFSNSVGNISNLSTTEKSTVVGAINEINSKVSPTVLYSNNSGTQSSIISLNDNVENYDFIEIYYHRTPTIKLSTKVYKIATKNTLLQEITYLESSGEIIIRTSRINLSEDMALWESSCCGYCVIKDTLSQPVKGNLFYITQIIGYK